MNIYLLMSALRCPADAFRIYSVVNDILLAASRRSQCHTNYAIFSPQF